MHIKDVNPVKGEQVVVYGDCSTTRSDIRWRLTSGGSIQNIDSGLCWDAADNAGATAGTAVVLGTSCNIERARYQFIPVPTPASNTTEAAITTMGKNQHVFF